MQIKVRLFAILREWTRQTEFDFSLQEGASCLEALSDLKSKFEFPESVLGSCMAAVNGVYAHHSQILRTGDELALLPPVSGG